MNKVTNISKEPRQFRDQFSGKEIVLAPGESVEVRSAPTHPFFKVEEVKAAKGGN